MKMNYLLAGLFFCTNVVEAGCDNSTDFSDDDILSRDVPQAHLDAFNTKYPKTSATWEKDRGMLKAEFRERGNDTDVWYDVNGTWLRSETDLEAKDLPQIVRDAVQNHFPSYRIEDVDLIESPSEIYYLIELEKNDYMERKIKVTPEGEILS